MPEQDKTPGAVKIERRKRWRDRRVRVERRNDARLSHMDGECRNLIPRREADLTGKLVEGELWWSGDRSFV